MKPLAPYEIWFVTGSQHLYGEETLAKVAENARTITSSFDASAEIPVAVVFKPVVKTPDEITALLGQANADAKCIGLVTWCHTFSPSKMWINGLSILRKPLLHLHTQFNRDLPWGEIDMDFMNLNQSAHGDREHGYIMSRMKIERKVVVGHWSEPEVVRSIGVWSRAAAGWAELRQMKIARFGDNMRQVAVTEGDKVEAQIKFGVAVNGYGVGDLVAAIAKVSDADTDERVRLYEREYRLGAEVKKGGAFAENVRTQARIELALGRFLKEGGFGAFTTTFEDLHGLKQLPGLAVQRLMADGYGFGAEGDWKHAAMVRVLKVMGTGLAGGSSFMEDYTYHLNPEGGMKVLGAHMLEVCPSIAGKNPVSLEVHPLGIGGKDDPARLVFSVPAGAAVNASLIDMGNRFRMIVNDVDCVTPDAELPKLPVARALWIPRPNLKEAAACWIYAGGAHHTAFSQALTSEHLEDFCTMAGIECITIGEGASVRDIKNELRWNEVSYMFSK
ncbi:MAG TPA: L-arabinose isomerase [Bacteroidota bacterium]|nr:L-arabinose isomerase [Bacteroidota bacterium]